MTYYPQKNTLSFVNSLKHFQVPQTQNLLWESLLWRYIFFSNISTAALVITLATGTPTQAVADDQLGAQCSLTFLAYFVCSVL